MYGLILICFPLTFSILSSLHPSIYPHSHKLTFIKLICSHREMKCPSGRNCFSIVMKEYIWVNGALMLIDPILHPFLLECYSFRISILFEIFISGALSLYCFVILMHKKCLNCILPYNVSSNLSLNNFKHYSATTVLRRLKYVHYKVLAIQYTIKCLVINRCNGNGTNPPTI